MSTKTRRLVFLSVLVLGLMLPAETILLRALVTPQQEQAVREWVVDLTEPEFASAVGKIQHYPLLYRRQLMGRLTPEGRSQVWRGHLQAYLAAHPELDAVNAGLISSASTVLSAEFFADATEERRASLHAVASQIEAALGREEAEYLLYRLGPRDGTFASFEPLAMFLTNKVRGLVQANATTAAQCECATYWGCYDSSTSCSQAISCSTDNWWPMCGWAWSDPCDGLCIYGG